MFARGHIERFLSTFAIYYFTLGRGCPKQRGVTELWFTHRGRILGHFEIERIVQNAGQLPKLTSMDGEPSGWQIKPDRWVAVCRPPFHLLEETVYHEAFRGWRYFNLDKYRGTLAAKIPL